LHQGWHRRRLRRLEEYRGGAPLRRGEKLRDKIEAQLGNMTGHPCLTIRAGFTEQRTRETPAYLDAEIKEKDGPPHTAPYGITIVASLFDEAAALTLGRALETALGVSTRRPELM
jgi:Asp-tRNA(Asn)/Glu-tRNA(Gln) amidotransferase A subunit family amidase